MARDVEDEVYERLYGRAGGNGHAPLPPARVVGPDPARRPRSRPTVATASERLRGLGFGAIGALVVVALIVAGVSGGDHHTRAKSAAKPIALGHGPASTHAATQARHHRSHTKHSVTSTTTTTSTLGTLPQAPVHAATHHRRHSRPHRQSVPPPPPPRPQHHLTASPPAQHHPTTTTTTPTTTSTTPTTTSTTTTSTTPSPPPHPGHGSGGTNGPGG